MILVVTADVRGRDASYVGFFKNEILVIDWLVLYDPDRLPKKSFSYTVNALRNSAKGTWEDSDLGWTVYPIRPVFFMIPAMAVHLWLPLFLVGGIGTYFFGLFFRSVSRAQWFITKGNEHPLRAIGLVAATVVLIGMSVVRIASS